MPKVHKVVARTDRYRLGAKIPDEKTKSGYRIDKSKPRDENDSLFCKKGDTYYHYTRYGASKVETLEYPKPSQLTGSEFLCQVYEIGENFVMPETFEALEIWRDETKDTLETLLEETEEKLDNMPEGLQEGDTGQLLQSRIDSLQEWIDELDNLECEPDEAEDDWKANWLEENEPDDVDNDTQVQIAWEEYLAEQIADKVEEISTEYQGE